MCFKWMDVSPIYATTGTLAAKCPTFRCSCFSHELSMLVVNAEQVVHSGLIRDWVYQRMSY